MAKALAVFLGNAIGDALGAHTEFINFDPKRKIKINNWKDIEELYKRNFIML